MMRRVFLVGLLAGLLSCGGGGTSVASGGIGGTGVSQGPVGGIASFVLTGTDWNLAVGGQIEIDGETSPAFTQVDDLEKIGLVMQVEGSRSENGSTGTADRVVVDNRIQGPVTLGSLAATPLLAPEQAMFWSFGQRFVVDRSTAFDPGTSFDDFTTNADVQGWVVELSGLADAGGGVRVTRVEVRSMAAPVLGITEVGIEGVVTNLQPGGDFQIQGSGTTVFVRGSGDPDCTGAGATLFPDGPVSNLDPVEVRGLFLSDTEICADQVELDDFLLSENRFESEAIVTGVTSNLPDMSEFQIGLLNVLTDAKTEFEPPGIETQIRPGMTVEVEGDLENGVVEARAVKQRSTLRITALVDPNPPPTADGFSVLGLFVALTDDTEIDPGPTVGTGYVEVRGVDDGLGGFTALEVKEETAGNADRVRIRGRVEAVSLGVLTILGVDVAIDAQTSCEDENGASVDCATNFLVPSVVGRLVQADDRDAPFDAFGVADEVEFED